MAGATAALGATLAGISYRTFTAPLPRVKRASLAALENMGMKPDSVGTFDAGEIIVARTPGVTVEIELEALTERATRMRVATRDGGLFYDAATANEIVAQTQKMLEARRASASVRGAKRVNSFD
ncbi:MAG: hypothetical protein ACJ8G5_13355 [Burkholderiales bacterium]